MRHVRLAAQDRMKVALEHVMRTHQTVVERRGKGPRDLRAELEERDAIIAVLAEALQASHYFNSVPLNGKADSEYADARQAALRLSRHALTVAGQIPRESADAP